MKTHIFRLLIIVVLIVWSINPLTYAETSVSLGVRYDTFSDNLSPEGKGNEMTIPFGIVYRGDRLLLRLETAYGQARVTPGADAESKISSMTDTLLAGSYIFSKLPVGIVVGVDVNVPTGKERLRRDEQAAEAGERHDLFEVDNFGEGVNVGLNLGLVKELGPLNLGVSGVYIFKDKYDPTEETSEDDLDPGDQTLVFAWFHWDMTSWLWLDSMLAYSHFAADTINGQESSQDGRKIVLNGNIRVRRHPVEIVVGAQNVFQSKNKELVGTILETEPENSNGSELFGWFDFTYRASSKLDLHVLGDIRDYGESDRKNELNGLPFEGKRFRYAVGPGFTYALNDHLTWNTIVKYFVMDQKRDLLQEQDVTFRGVNVSAGMTYTF